MHKITLPLISILFVSLMPWFSPAGYAEELKPIMRIGIPQGEGTFFLGSHLALLDNDILVATASGYLGEDNAAVYLIDFNTGSVLSLIKGLSSSWQTNVATKGNKFIIGVPQLDSEPSDNGYVIFDEWTGTGTLNEPITFRSNLDSSIDNNGFGYSVAFLGNQIVVGDPYAYRRSAFSLEGAVQIFEVAGITGKLVRTLKSPTARDGDCFGYALATSENDVLIGNPCAADSDVGRAVGEVYLFDGSNGTLKRTFKNPLPAEWGRFGSALATKNGKALISAVSSSSDMVHLFDLNTGRLLRTFPNPQAHPYSNYGSSVAFYGTCLVLIGDSFTSYIDGKKYGGIVYGFNTETGELLHTYKSSNTQNYDSFGASIVVAKDKIIIGSPQEQVAADAIGAVYVFQGPFEMEFPPQTPWSTNAFGQPGTFETSGTNFYGYHFVPKVPGKITRLGGLFNGTATVKLFRYTQAWLESSLLASTRITASNAWSYNDIAPVDVQAGTSYIVAVYPDNPLELSMHSFNDKDIFPKTFGNITIVSGTYNGGWNTPNLPPFFTTPGRMYGEVDITFVPGQTPWETNNNGILRTGYAWNYAMGYHFTPQVDGLISHLGGRFNGTKKVKLFNKGTGALLASADVTSMNYNWARTVIRPLPVKKGVQYTVAVYLAGSGGAYQSLNPPLPQTYEDIRIDGATHAYTGNDPNARPTINLTNYIYGQVDVTFQSVQIPWKTNAFGELGTHHGYPYWMGYRFTPKKNGVVTHLGGFFCGNKKARIFNDRGDGWPGEMLAETLVSACNDWGYTQITPVALQAGRTYTVVVNINGSGGSERFFWYGQGTLPRTFGDIEIKDSIEWSSQYDGTDVSTIPMRTDIWAMFGQADIVFVPDGN
ncbi:MAG: DUF4082 domain-containing protein [Candidatus Omnitrophica bacterium]|nr:DUF4082 domain-containing protein [Candidatus Omnitrophota bacterium]